MFACERRLRLLGLIIIVCELGHDLAPPLVGHRLGLFALYGNAARTAARNHLEVRGGDRLVGDALRLLRIVERREALVDRQDGRRERGDDDRLAAAAEGFLEQSRELRVAVGDARRVVALLAFAQRRDDPAESEQRLVDVLALALARIADRVSRRFGAFRAGEIDEMELTRALHRHGAILCRRCGLHLEREDAVRAARVLIHARLADAPALLRAREEREHVLLVPHNVLGEILDDDALLRARLPGPLVLDQLQPRRLVEQLAMELLVVGRAVGEEQIRELFVVDLEV